MSKIEKIRKYIKKRGAPHNPRYDASIKELLALCHEMKMADAIALAIEFGKAKGYQQALAEGRTQV